MLLINTILLFYNEAVAIETVLEWHNHRDSSFPLIFHLDSFTNEDRSFVLHWHENIELLFFVEGSAKVTCGAVTVEAGQGDIAVINSGYLHATQAVTSVCRYYCLIIDKNFCEDFDIFVSDINISRLVTDPEANAYFHKIVYEMNEKGCFYKSAVKAEAINLMIHLCRYHAYTPEHHDKVNTHKMQIVKESIAYIKKHFQTNIAIDDLCRAVGLSKHYFCRVFKEITGKTAIDYINLMRCDYARNLLCSGKYNISECAEMCGFNNLSYFSKTYKKHMGRLPSSEGK